MGDERVHLALAHLGRLKQGRLLTLCGKLAVTELSPFVAAGAASERCRTCFGKVDEDRYVKVAPSKPAKARPKAEVIDIASRQPVPEEASPAGKATPVAGKAKPVAGKAKPAPRKKAGGKASPGGRGTR